VSVILLIHCALKPSACELLLLAIIYFVQHVIDPWRACVTRLWCLPVCVSVCLSVCYHSSGGIVHFHAQTEVQTVLLWCSLNF